MKKTLSILLCLMMALAGLFTLAESDPEAPYNTPLPFPDDGIPRSREEAQGESIQLVIDGKTVILGFDSTPEYSSIENGSVQASFYQYGSDSDTLYELYLTFPEEVEAGMVINPDYAMRIAAEASVVLIISDSTGERYYFSSVLDGLVYPETSDFSISFDAVERAGSGCTYAGTVSATLVALDLINGEAQSSLEIEAAPFSFTLDSGSAQERHTDPLPTDAPNDMRKV